MSESFELFWSTFPADLCNRKGSKSMAEKSWNKIKPAEHEQILINMREMMRSDRKVKKTGAGKPEWIWPMASTWLNQKRFDCMDDLKQSADIPDDARLCSCGKPVGIVNKCWSCHDIQNPPDLDANREAMRRIGLVSKPGEDRAAYNARCREWLQQKGGVGRVIASKQAVHG